MTCTPYNPSRTAVAKEQHIKANPNKKSNNQLITISYCNISVLPRSQVYIGIPNTDPNVHVRVLYFSFTILVHTLARARGNCAGGGKTVLGRHQYPLDNVAVPTNTHLTVGMTFCPITFHVKFGDLYHSDFRPRLQFVKSPEHSP